MALAGRHNGPKLAASDMLYERVRLEPIAQHEFGSPESRLVSLGHSLHLAGV